MKLALLFSTAALLGITASAAPLEGSAPRYSSLYGPADRKIGTLDVDRYTGAPLQIRLMARLNLPPAEAFDLVSRRLPEWVSAIPHVGWDHSHSAQAGACGQGSVRTCAFNRDQVVEDIRHWEEGRVYAYAADPVRTTASFPIKDHLGVFVVESDGNGGSLVTWRQYFRGRYALLAPLARFGMGRVMRPGLARLVAQHGGELVQTRD